MKIVVINMCRIEKCVCSYYVVQFSYDDVVLMYIVVCCQEVEMGVCNIENIFNKFMLFVLVSECL